MNIKINSREDLINLLTWSLEDAPILDSELLSKSNEYLSEIESIFTIKSNGELSDSLDDSSQSLNLKITNYLFEKYEEIFVTDEDKLIGTLGENVFELYDGNDRKLYIDAEML